MSSAGARRAGPVFSILTPVYEPPLDVLEETVQSVLDQDFEDWEWVLVDDASPSDGVRQVLRRAARDRRIHVIERTENGHIVKASNDALQAATGDFVVLLDHDDLLTPDALSRVKEEVDRFQDLDYVYSDEDKIGGDGRYYDLFLKPDWSPERLRGQMYTSHLSVVRRTLATSVGGFRQGFEGSQDHDLVLRVTEQARRIVHVPEVLYHWRVVAGSAAADPQAKPYAAKAGEKAVQESLERRGIRGRVVPAPGAWGHYRIERELPPERRVSIVIPTRGGEGLIWGSRRSFVLEAVRSAVTKTGHPNLEVVVVYDEPTPAEVLRQLRQVAGDRLVLVPFRKPFNFSEKVNLGVVGSTGDRVVLLNDDVEVISEQWLEQLVAPLEEPDVGLTGAKLYFSDSTIQHAGHRYEGGEYHHPYLGVPGSLPGRMGDLLINREVSGVTAACAAMRREVYDAVGGLAETLPANFNDVDLSYKVSISGYRTVWVANCELFHFESRTRSRVVEPWEHMRAMARWGTPSRDRFMPA